MSYIWKQRQYTKTKENSKEEICIDDTLDSYGVHKLLNMSFGLKKVVNSHSQNNNAAALPGW